MQSFTVIIIIIIVVVVVVVTVFFIVVVADVVRFKGLTTLLQKIQVFWNVMMC